MSFQPGSRGESNYSASRPGPIDNTQGWISLAAGVISLILLAVGSMAGFIVFGTATAVLVAISAGARSLVARGAGTSTALATPILGIVLALTTVVIYIGSLLLVNAAAGAGPADYNPDDVHFPNNPEMSVMFDTAYAIEHELHQISSSGNWPDELVADSEGTVWFDSVALGTIAPGQTFEYLTFNQGQSFQFTIYGTVPGETVFYTSDTDIITGNCYETDTTCFS